MTYIPPNPNGQATMANSAPVAIASNQSAIPVTDNSGSLTVDAPVGTPAFVRLSDGTAAITTLPVSLAANQSVNNAQIAGVAVSTGNGVTGTGSQRVTIASDNTAFPISQISTSVTPGVAATNLGKAEDAAHASGDTGVAVWGVRNDNAATALTSANGDYSPIAVDSTGTNFYRESPANTATTSNVAGAITSTTLIAANAARRSVIIFNDSASDCYIKYGTTASSTSFTVLAKPYDTYTIKGSEYAGIITGIWVTATGNARVTEVV